MIKKFLSGTILFNMMFFQCGAALSQVIEDEVATQSFQSQNLSKPVFKREVIEDEMALELKNKNLVRPAYKKVLLEDEVIKKDTKIQSSTKPAVHYKLIDENAEIVRVFVSPAKLITTKDSLKIGQKVEFKTTKDVYKDGKIFIKKETPVEAFIELISKADCMGEPDEIEIGRFVAKNNAGKIVELTGTVRKQGADRGIWVRPLYNTGYGMPFYFVKGGKTRIKPEQNFELYYE